MWNERGTENEIFFEKESARVGGMERQREGNKAHTTGAEDTRTITLPGGKSLLNVDLGEYIEDWQFLALWPQAMGNPTPQTRAGGRLRPLRGEGHCGQGGYYVDHRIRLAKDGANIAEWLLSIRAGLPAVFEGIIEAMQSVLPYAEDVQPVITSELERAVYVQLTEQDFNVPGWLLSSGTLRVLALLALLRQPYPPPLIVIEEIENGLDPRTLNLVVEEIRAAITLGTTQVICTTHSPYLLDLLDLSHIVVVDREEGETVFHRPNAKELAEWAKSFSPGQLYTMGRFQRK